MINVAEQAALLCSAMASRWAMPHDHADIDDVVESLGINKYVAEAVQTLRNEYADELGSKRPGMRHWSPAPWPEARDFWAEIEARIRNGEIT